MTLYLLSQYNNLWYAHKQSGISYWLVNHLMAIIKTVANPITDIHCHILPGVDDGAADWDMSLEMLRRSWNAGVRKLIATPHYLPWRHTITARIIPDLCRELAERAERELGISPDIYPGQELYYHRDILEDLETGKALSLAGSRYVLVEFDEGAPWSEIRLAADQFRRGRWQMIAAHAERYSALRDPEHLRELLEVGAQLQSNADEMTRGFLNGTTRWLKKRYAAREIQYIGSDMHNLTSRPPLSGNILRWTEKLEEDYRIGILGSYADDILQTGASPA